MTHNGFSGTLNPTQSINPAFTPQPHSVTALWPVVISRPSSGRQQSRHQGPGLPGGPQIRGEKEKRKEVYLSNAFIVATTLKALRRGSHSITCK